MRDIQQKLLATFAIEHRDHVEQIRLLLASVTNATVPGPELDEVFRRAHSLKGAARAVDLTAVEGLAHRLETLFARVRRGEHPLDQDASRVVLRVLDASEDCVNAVGQVGEPESMAAALLAIQKILGEQGTEEQGREPVAVSSALVVPTAPSTPAFHAPETMRITRQNFEGFFRSAGGLISETQRQANIAELLKGIASQVALLEREGARIRRVATRALSATNGVNATDFAALIPAFDSMERQARLVSRQIRTTRHAHHRHAWRLRQLSQQLQADMGEARLVPAESLFEGFRKMMRDLARAEGKEIDFRITGAHVNADRRVLDALKDPLRHILRNSVSHGIETAAERLNRGKAPAGSVALSMETSGASLSIVVEDDGRGIDLERVTSTAVREALLPETGATPSPQQLYQLLLRPGFSTAPAVTPLSGRGMGLSVVHEAVRRLQGDLVIAPVASGGMRITISVPLSVASHRLMVVACGGAKFAMPMLGIEAMHRVAHSKIVTVEGKPAVVLHGVTLPFAALGTLLDIESPASADPILPLLVVRAGDERAAIAVDAILREADLPIQDFSSFLPAGARLSSGVVLEDGSVALVVAPVELIRAARESGPAQLPQTSRTAPPPTVPAAPSILVVDDSMTTRTLEKAILEARGYRVRVAVDGVEALMRLRQEQPDLVIADVEMPRLNGFGLIEAMKKDPALAAIPVIIVSSVEKREEQERGLALGADAYIIKQKFDQDELLAVIRQIL